MNGAPYPRLQRLLYAGGAIVALAGQMLGTLIGAYVALTSHDSGSLAFCGLLVTGATALDLYTDHKKKNGKNGQA